MRPKTSDASDSGGSSKASDNKAEGAVTKKNFSTHPSKYQTSQLNRQTFTTSRMMDFFSEKELTAQIDR